MSESPLLEQAIAGAVRALANRPDLEIVYGSRRPPAEAPSERLTLPRLPHNPKRHRAYRGSADLEALKLLHHDADLMREHRPQQGDAAELFSAFETARYAALGLRSHLGVSANLRAHWGDRAESEAPPSAPQMREQLGLQLWMVRALSGVELTGQAAELADAQGADLAKRFGEIQPQSLASLCERLGDQQAFAEALLDLMHRWELLEEPPEEAADEDQGADPQGADQDGGDPSAGEAEIDGEEEGEQVEVSADLGAQAEVDLSRMQLAEEEDEPQEQHWDGQDGWLENQTDGAVHEGYGVFTDEFDQIARAGELAEETELNQLRKHLDELVRPHQGLIGRLANRLQRLLLAQQHRSWEFDLEEGILNTARLVRVVTDPGAPLSFKRELESPFRDTVFTLLIDCSGSMRGRSMSMAAVCADVLGSTLERCGIRTEVLGFTSRHWKGGDSRKRWEFSGKPPAPGRVSDLLHIVFKGAGDNWRRSRRNLGLMLKEGLLKENVDGEALLWAHERLMRTRCERRILMVLSDGAPVDDSTLNCNHSGYLERHLRQVIRAINERSPVELVAIGIGHDVRSYYRRAVMVTSAEDLGRAMADELYDLFSINRRVA
ncbi:MAG: cobaltochelatase subunit CobT [Gammaproteobacteria bacterium AqS3]|nr:cobaltochelatase subunit CobT [Gammaproteobacteria bacterium AqS3]